MVAPSLCFKSEAIVHPDEVARYIHPQQCALSYNPTLMALLWEALATRDTTLLRHSMSKRFRIHAGTNWLNYIRSHDDVGWTFSDEDAAEVGINGYDHRRFLNHYYTGNFPGSFARGVPYEYNQETGDCRICGTTASLAGLESALEAGSEAGRELAMARIELLYSVLMSVGGIPLVYLGDEMGVCNDFSYRAHRSDGRWVHRPRLVDLTTSIEVAAGQPGAWMTSLARLAATRAATPAFSGNDTDFHPCGNKHLFAYTRRHEGELVLVLCNFSESAQSLAPALIDSLFGSQAVFDLVSQQPLEREAGPGFAPYQYRWLVGGEAP